MKCENYLNLIDELVEGELDESDARQVNSHVAACRECAAHYASLKQEREMYEQYFEIEPSRELWVELQPQLASVQARETVKSSGLFARIFSWKSGVFGSLKLTPALAGLAVILVFGIGFGLLELVFDEETSQNASIIKTESITNQNSTETIKDEQQISVQKTGIHQNDSVHSNKILTPYSFSNESAALAAKDKKTFSRKEISDNKSASAKEKNVLAKSIRPNEKSQARRSQVENVEKEAEGDFYALPFAGVLNESNENLQIIRVELPRSSLLALGVDVQAESAAGNVKTDLLIGADGVARAIRLLK